MLDKNYGGKANSLFKLKNNGFNVPNFFVIDCDCYLEFLNSNKIYEKVVTLIKEDKYEKIENLIMDGVFAEGLEKKIYEEFSKLDSKYVSVRSSAINEDGKEKSYAGQYSTILNVDVNNLFSSIKKCWCSLYSENVISYSSDVSVYGMNVVVQKMINPDYAGVAFTIDNTSDTNNYSVIEVVQGLGEQLVSGETTPTKFIIRRETKFVDLKLGDILLDERLIENLEEVILNIEELYSLPMDIEFAIKDDEIFILQARPITSFLPITKQFSLTLSRPNSLIEEYIYFNGEFLGIKSVTRNLYYFKPLFMYNYNNKNTDIYYNLMDLEESPWYMYYYMDLDFEIILKKYEEVKIKIRKLENIINNELDFDIHDYISDLIDIYPFTSLGQLAGNFNDISERLKDLLYDFRFNYDYIIHKATDFLVNRVKRNLPEKYKEYVNFIQMEEVINDKLPSIEELIKRTKGYIYYGELYVVTDYEQWMKEHNFDIKEEITTSLKGQVVCGGSVEGNVCKVFNENDFDKFQEGDILVTPMTTPKFTKLIKRASAIVTDEGGVTCHAAIISRELKVPCIVGCKNITKLLNDGDIIKLNGSSGEIQIIKQKMEV